MVIIDRKRGTVLSVEGFRLPNRSAGTDSSTSAEAETVNNALRRASAMFSDDVTPLEEGTEQTRDLKRNAEVCGASGEKTRGQNIAVSWKTRARPSCRGGPERPDCQTELLLRQCGRRRR